MRRIGSYDLLGQIGRGGSGVVYRARHANTGHSAALKLVRIDALSTGSAVRFQKEARIVGALNHPGIVRVFDSGVHDDGVLRLPWIATELVEGSRFPGEPAGQPRDRLLGTFVAVCDAVAHAHARGVLHRDLKPQNVLVDADGNPHVVDFGIAKVLDSASGGSTQGGDLLGTPAYMAPEIARWGAVAASYASDIWSLGAGRGTGWPRRSSATSTTPTFTVSPIVRRHRNSPGRRSTPCWQRCASNRIAGSRASCSSTPIGP
ncbi:MAG: serine/threonine protein kinase [Planctomycetes bacterium]|nr:serine/threonine protein kinase [Planctomycetota bacterium]